MTSMFFTPIQEIKITWTEDPVWSSYYVCHSMVRTTLAPHISHCQVPRMHVPYPIWPFLSQLCFLLLAWILLSSHPTHTQEVRCCSLWSQSSTCSKRMGCVTCAWMGGGHSHIDQCSSWSDCSMPTRFLTGITSSWTNRMFILHQFTPVSKNLFFTLVRTTVILQRNLGVHLRAKNNAILINTTYCTGCPQTPVLRITEWVIFLNYTLLLFTLDEVYCMFILQRE